MKSEAQTDDKHRTRLMHTTTIVAAYLGHNQVPIDKIGSIIRDVFDATGIDGPVDPIELRPAVPVKKSVNDEYLVCLEDGRKLKMLKRFLRSHYNMTPEQYRAKWHLPSDYPMVAPAYARKRSAFAKAIGLGRTTNSKKPKKGK